MCWAGGHSRARRRPTASRVLAQGDLTLSSAEVVAHFLDFTIGHRKHPANPRKPRPFTKESRYKSRRSIYEKFHAHYKHDGFKMHLLAKTGHSQDRLEELLLPGWAGVRRPEPARAPSAARLISRGARRMRHIAADNLRDDRVERQHLLVCAQGRQCLSPQQGALAARAGQVALAQPAARRARRALHDR